MKRKISLFLSLLMALPFAACKNPDNTVKRVEDVRNLTVYENTIYCLGTAKRNVCIARRFQSAREI